MDQKLEEVVNGCFRLEMQIRKEIELDTKF